jgi:hypothetical protein
MIRLWEFSSKTPKRPEAPPGMVLSAADQKLLLQAQKAWDKARKELRKEAEKIAWVPRHVLLASWLTLKPWGDGAGFRQVIALGLETQRRFPETKGIPPGAFGLLYDFMTPWGINYKGEKTNPEKFEHEAHAARVRLEAFRATAPETSFGRSRWEGAVDILKHFEDLVPDMKNEYRNYMRQNWGIDLSPQFERKAANEFHNYMRQNWGIDVDPAQIKREVAAVPEACSPTRRRFGCIRAADPG